MADTRPDPPNRRDFLAASGLMLFGPSAMPPASAAAQPSALRAASAISQQSPSQSPHDGSNDAPTARTIAEAERLAGVQYTPAQRETMLQTIGEQLAKFERRHEHPFLPNDLAPAQTFDPRLRWMNFDQLQPIAQRTDADPGPLPERDEDIAFAPVTQLSRWIERGMLSSARLTDIYITRLKQFNPELECVITLTEHLARAQAAQADIELRNGHYRGPLHGIPWGAKDLLDTAGVPTTWGATPYIERVPDHDATVVQRLQDAGAVLVAKLTLGALAYNDIWFGGRTNNPWNPEQGSSGSSAGSAAATAAGLVGFSIGTETYGSIVSPCMRCGTTGLRPTFGRVSRTGAMALCWSLDKIGPICRTAEDAVLVLDAINGEDAHDPSSIGMPLSFNANNHPRGIRIGWNPQWFEPPGAHELDQQIIKLCGELGMELIEIDLPDWPYDSLVHILFAEAAAAFEELMRTGEDETLRWQEPRAWPNMLRQAWFIPGPEIVQAERLRRKCMEMMAERFDRIDAIIAPSFAANLLLITNCTGHPSLTIRTGFQNPQTPHGITIIGNLFDEGTLCTIGMALERALDVWHERPPLTDVQNM